MTTDFIAQFQLSPAAKVGGFSKNLYVASETVSVAGTQRPLCSVMLYSLGSEQCSPWHRLPCDIIWHFYAGSDVVIHCLSETKALSCVRLGALQVGSRAVSSAAVKANCWFAVEVANENANTLLGMTVCPACTDDDIELGDTKALVKMFPAHEHIIQRLSFREADS